MPDLTGEPFNRPEMWKKMLGAVHDTMGADFLRQGLEARNVPDEEIEEIMQELARGEGGA